MKKLSKGYLMFPMRSVSAFVCKKCAIFVNCIQGTVIEVCRWLKVMCITLELME